MNKISIVLYAGVISYFWFGLVPQLRPTLNFSLTNISFKSLSFSTPVLLGWAISLGMILLVSHLILGTQAPPPVFVPHLVGGTKGGDICGPIGNSLPHSLTSAKQFNIAGVNLNR
jgi:hypothetical protein